MKKQTDKLEPVITKEMEEKEISRQKRYINLGYNQALKDVEKMIDKMEIKQTDGYNVLKKLKQYLKELGDKLNGKTN